MGADVASYVDAFVHRAVSLGGGTAVAIEEPGLRGVGERVGESPVGRAIVTDRCEAAGLGTRLEQLGVGYVSVVNENVACVEALNRSGPFRRDFSCAIMASADLTRVVEPPAPAGLTAQKIQPDKSETPGPSLENAVRANLGFDDEEADVTEEWLIAFLRSIPHPLLLAAVDADMAIRATSGAFVVGDEATVIFVGTDQGLRGRGVGTWMTATALAAARADGATSAFLDATDAGESIYRRLGFERIGAVTRYTYVAGEG